MSERERWEASVRLCDELTNVGNALKCSGRQALKGVLVDSGGVVVVVVEHRAFLAGKVKGKRAKAATARRHPVTLHAFNGLGSKGL